MQTWNSQAVLGTLFCMALLALTNLGRSQSAQQQDFPEPPNDATKVYYLEGDTLTPLPFEAGISPFDIFKPAVNDRIARVRVSGPKAHTILTDNNLRFFVFVADRMDPPPHQLVRLTSNKSERSLRISLLKGRKGYAPFAEDNIQLERRILRRLRMSAGVNRFLFVNYLELRPRVPLAAGEYAIIGDSLTDIATFRVGDRN